MNTDIRDCLARLKAEYPDFKLSVTPSEVGLLVVASATHEGLQKRVAMSGSKEQEEEMVAETVQRMVDALGAFKRPSVDLGDLSLPSERESDA